MLFLHLQAPNDTCTDFEVDRNTDDHTALSYMIRYKVKIPKRFAYIITERLEVDESP